MLLDITNILIVCSYVVTGFQVYESLGIHEN
jgi:hypothetical protein